MFHVILTYGNESGLYEPSSGINLLICLDVSPRQCKLCCCLSSKSVCKIISCSDPWILLDIFLLGMAGYLMQGNPTTMLDEPSMCIMDIIPQFP